MHSGNLGCADACAHPCIARNNEQSVQDDPAFGRPDPDLVIDCDEHRVYDLAAHDEDEKACASHVIPSTPALRPTDWNKWLFPILFAHSCIWHETETRMEVGVSVFEIIMLACFGAAWPVSIYKSVKTRAVEGKSLPFLIIIVLGYAAGILHKVLYRYDLVIYLYILNVTMVSIDIALYVRNRRFHMRRASP
jgi:hypothetical protein